jgi:hypothetical protein
MCELYCSLRHAELFNEPDEGPADRLWDVDDCVAEAVVPVGNAFKIEEAEVAEVRSEDERLEDEPDKGPALGDDVSIVKNGLEGCGVKLECPLPAAVMLVLCFLLGHPPGF